MNTIKRLLKSWLGIYEINTKISQLQADIYDNDALLNGFAVPKVIYKEKIWYGGKEKIVK
jgi:hypothetical protein